jgi:hypothetical protein
MDRSVVVGEVARIEHREIRGRRIDAVSPDFTEPAIGRAFARPGGSILMISGRRLGVDAVRIVVQQQPADIEEFIIGPAPPDHPCCAARTQITVFADS